MKAPFTHAEFMEVFARYNATSWVVQYVLLALALSAVIAVLRKGRYRDRWASGVLAMLWLWSGIGFHLTFFTDINPAAIAFGILFVAQGSGFFMRGVMRHGLAFDRPIGSARGIVGLVVMAYAIIAYPLISVALGHRWPHAPTFGAPCPVDIFTLGLLLWARPPVPRSLLAVPLGWALVASLAAWQYGMHEDWGLAAAAAMVAVWRRPPGLPNAASAGHGPAAG